MIRYIAHATPFDIIAITFIPFVSIIKYGFQKIKFRKGNYSGGVACI